MCSRSSGGACLCERGWRAARALRAVERLGFSRVGGFCAYAGLSLNPIFGADLNAAALGRHFAGRSRFFACHDSLLGRRGRLGQSRFHRIGHIFGVTARRNLADWTSCLTRI